MRFLRALAALLALLVGVAGVPAALVALGGNPLPGRVSWATVVESLRRPDDGSILIGVVTVVCWVAWLVFASSVLLELANLISGYRLRLTLPGLGGPQRLAAGLLLAVLAVGSLPALSAHAAPAPAPTQVPHTHVVQSSAMPGEDGDSAVESRRQRVGTEQEGPPPAPASESVLTTAQSGSPSRWHLVQHGDDLWSLSEKYYGDGREWRRIAAANPDVLSGGPDRLLVGWRLRVPEALTSGDAHQAETRVVRAGDTLSSIAERAYGKPSRWEEVFDANRDVLDDPDEIEVGTRLELPKPRAEGDRLEASERQPDDSTTRASKPASGEGAASRSKADQQPTTGTTAGPGGPSNPATRAAPQPTAVAPSAPQPTAVAPTAPQPTAPESTAPQPTAGASTVPQSTGVEGTPSQSPGDAVDPAQAEVALQVASIGGLLAAALLGGLALRRRTQLQARPLGRRIAQPAPSAQQLETALGHRQQPLSLATLDLALRAVAAHVRRADRPLPPFTLAKVGPDAIELVMAEAVPEAPVGFQVSGTSWLLAQSDAGYLRSVPGVDSAVRPFPALVSLGRDGDGRQVLVDLEAMGLLALEADSEDLAAAAMSAMAVELSFSPWAEEMSLTLVGGASSLPDVLGKHNVTRCDDLDRLIDRVERRATEQRAHLQRSAAGQQRGDPDLADAWAPEIVLINQRPHPDQTRRLLSVVTARPRVTLAVVVAGPVAEAPWSLQLAQAPEVSGQASPQVEAVLTPSNLRILPQLVLDSAEKSLVDLVAATGTEETTPAPWWDHGDAPPSVVPAGNVTYLGKRFGGWGQDRPDAAKPTEGKGSDAVAQLPTGGSTTENGRLADRTGADRHHPVLRLLGPVELAGARGSVPPRASKQCLEYCCWLLEHPGTTAQAMASALVIAEGTRRSNMSRLRTWLGADAEGEPYLPDAYTGRIVLHPCVSSDWQRLQILTAAGVNKTSTGGLCAALDLVRGAPLADTAPGQWHWAEELRTDMISVVRDIGVEVASRALAEHDTDLARWAASRALAAAPGDELLIAARIRTEHLAGNTAETERLTLQLAGQARALGVDLDPTTVVLLQEVMEGRVRARLA